MGCKSICDKCKHRWSSGVSYIVHGGLIILVVNILLIRKLVTILKKGKMINTGEEKMEVTGKVGVGSE